MARLSAHREALVQLVRYRLDRRRPRGRCQRRRAGRAARGQTAGCADYLSNPAMPFHLWLRQLAADRMIDLHTPPSRRRRQQHRPRTAAGVRRGSTSRRSTWRPNCGPRITPAAAAICHELDRRFGGRRSIDEARSRDRADAALRTALEPAKSRQALGLTATGRRHALLRCGGCATFWDAAVAAGRSHSTGRIVFRT